MPPTAHRLVAPRTDDASSIYPEALTEPPPTAARIHAELDRARAEFHSIVGTATAAQLARRSDGTAWTNRQLLFHMLFGYLITRNLRLIVKAMSHAPQRVQHGFARALDATTPLFHRINYWGSCAGATVVSPARADAWLGRLITSLHRHLDRETEATLHRTMQFPVAWDPYFAQRMSLADVYHYATLHFDHHRRQLTIGDAG
jgi:hypothetical protein